MYGLTVRLSNSRRDGWSGATFGAVSMERKRASRPSRKRRASGLIRGTLKEGESPGTHVGRLKVTAVRLPALSVEAVTRVVLTLPPFMMMVPVPAPSSTPALAARIGERA